MKLLKGWGWIAAAWICIGVSRISGLPLEIVGVLCVIALLFIVIGLIRASLDYRRRSQEME